MVNFIEIILLLFIAGFLVIQNKDSFSSFFNRRRKIILDSCALIDGRVVEIVRNGFVADELVIPQFVLNELQLLADGHDGHKRERARFGLDIAHELQDAAFHAIVTIDRTQFPEVPATDDKLIALSKKLEGVLYTTDYNLAKVATIEHVSVLNVNELAQALRPVALPGETLKIKVVQKGSSPSQGVGYLDDGTMIVIEGAARHTGSIVEATVTRMHQTVAGKMVFGHIKEEQHHSDTRAAQLLSQQPQTSKQQQTSSAAPAPKKTNLHSRLLSRATPAAQDGAPAAASSAHRSRRRIHG